MFLNPSEIRRILSYTNGILYFYGVMHIKDIHNAVCNKISDKIGEGELQALLERAFYLEEEVVIEYDFSDDYFYNDELEDFYIILEEHRKRTNLKFRPVDERETNLVSKGMYLDIWNSYYINFHSFLVNALGIPMDEAIFEVFSFQSEIRNLNKIDEPLNEFIRVYDLTEEDSRVMTDFVRGLANYTSMWSLKGWSPNEILNTPSECLINQYPNAESEINNTESKSGSKKDKVILFPKKNPDIVDEFIVKETEAQREDNYEFYLPLKEKNNNNINIRTDNNDDRTNPSLPEWENLFEEVINFKKLAPWKWVNDHDTYGIVDPRSGITAYCSIMGAMGEHYALGAYLGPEGFDSLSYLMQSVPEENFEEYMNIQKCLMLSFEGRSDLSEQDRAVIKSLGLKFRGYNDWPLLRKYEPGLFPWYLNSWECRFMTDIIKQSIQIVGDPEKNKMITKGSEKGKILVRVPEKENENIIWHDTYQYPPKKHEKSYPSIKLVNEIAVKKMKKEFSYTGGTWEIDLFYSNYPTTEYKGQRPFFKKVFLVADVASYDVLIYAEGKDIYNEGSRFIDLLIKQVEKIKALPNLILVQNNETYFFLTDICRQLGINLKKIDRFEAIPDIKRQLRMSR